MVQLQSIFRVPVIWREKKLLLELNSEASLRELGEELQRLTDVKADSMKLIIPQSSTKSSKLFLPFSEEHSCLKLEDIAIVQGKPLRMMGVSEREVDQLLKDAKANLRIAGFEDEEKRMNRLSKGYQLSVKLPEGPYIFCDFRTLELPGVKLNPPASEALKRMHMLAADPGIVAIMRKHRWQVGIMTEMAPEGYVGISPVCLLGLNKNHGEEISLRLRTDDLKGFRKYETIKKTLLHELAHMVYSEHDSNFYALDRQLNQEAFALDWTRSRSHTLSDARFSGLDDMVNDLESESSLPHKLGGETSHMTASAREASVAAAYHRWVDSSIIHQESSECKGPESDNNTAEDYADFKQLGIEEITQIETRCVDSEMMEVDPNFIGNGRFDLANLQEEPDPDDLEASENRVATLPVSVDSQSMQVEKNTNRMRISEEPDPDDFEARNNGVQIENSTNGMRIGEEPDPDDSETRNNGGKIITSDAINHSREDQSQLGKINLEPDPDDSQETRIGGPHHDLDDKSEHLPQFLAHVIEEPDPDDQELRIIQDPVTIFSNRLTKAIRKLHNDLTPSEVNVIVQTLFKIIRNITENPNEMKYKRLRKANPVFQRNIANHKAAMEVLSLTGFAEDIVFDGIGNTETYLVLKRNDPALLWLAKSILETYFT